MEVKEADQPQRRKRQRGTLSPLRVVNTPQPSMAYMQPIHFLDIPHWRPEVPESNLRDVFSAEFARHCDSLAKRIAAPLKDDPFLLGGRQLGAEG